VASVVVHGLTETATRASTPAAAFSSSRPAASEGYTLSLHDALPIAAVGGVASFNDLHVRKVGSAYHLTAADAGLTGASSSAFDITPGALARFAWSSIVSPQVAGVQFSPSVTAYDAYDNVKTNYAGPALLSSNLNDGTDCASACVASVAFAVASPHFSSGVATVN